MNIVIVCQSGSFVDSRIRYGALRVTVEMAKCLQRSGNSVLLLGLAIRENGSVDDVPFVGASDNIALSRVAAGLANIDLAIGISRVDMFRWMKAEKFLVYHHGPHPIQGGVSPRVINMARIPVVCVSENSRQSQVRYGIRDSLIQIVPNAYDHSVFKPVGINRRSHSLIFCGSITGYKGVDIALNAFRIIKKSFPDAVFDIYGKNLSWRNVQGHMFWEGCLDEEGFPVWSKIQEKLPGCKYHGEVIQSELAKAFSTHSLMIMCSRVDETFFLCSIEAQACGCIPLLPRRGGCPETIREGLTGYLYDELSSESVAEKVFELWSSDMPNEHQRIQAERWVKETFCWEKSGQAMFKIIASLRKLKYRHRFVLMVSKYLWRIGCFLSRNFGK